MRHSLISAPKAPTAKSGAISQTSKSPFRSHISAHHNRSWPAKLLRSQCTSTLTYFPPSRRPSILPPSLNIFGPSSQQPMPKNFIQSSTSPAPKTSGIPPKPLPSSRKSLRQCLTTKTSSPPPQHRLSLKSPSKTPGTSCSSRSPLSSPSFPANSPPCQHLPQTSSPLLTPFLQTSHYAPLAPVALTPVL